MIGGVPAACLQLVYNLAFAEHDTSIDRQRKQRFINWVLVLGTFAFVATVVMLVAQGPLGVYKLYILASTIASLCCFGALGELLLVKKLHLRTVLLMVAGVTAGVFLIDLDVSAQASGRLWPLLLPAQQLLQQVYAPPAVSRGYFLICCMWLVVLRLDKSFDFQFRNFPGISGVADRKQMLCGCDIQPCADVVSNVLLVFTECVALGVVYIATHGLATDLEEDRRSRVKSMELTDILMRQIGQLDVASAEQLLKVQRNGLEPALAESFDLVLENLKCCIPFLPDVLLERIGPQPPTPRATQETFTLPESGEMAVVFTDIRCSTTIWEQAPDAMRIGLKKHNAVVRDVMEEHQGYEVKTIGDAFMVAFADVRDALNFALQVQEDLADATWPEGLVTPKVPRDDAWRGLILRIGVNAGPVSVEVNEVTGRSDLFGHTVNKASRFESNCIPGFVAISQELYEPLKNDKSVSAHTCGHISAVELAGVAQRTTLCHLVPDRLNQRLRYVTMGSTLLCMSAVESEKSQSSGTGSLLQKQVAVGSFSSSTSPVSASWSLPPMDLQSQGSHTAYSVGANLLCIDSATAGAVKLIVEDTDGLDTLPDAYRIDASMSALFACAERTGSSVLTLVGTVLMLGWNTQRSCPSHVENALRFVQISSDAVSDPSYVSVCVGLARGSCARGNVGSPAKRYLTVFGPCVQLSLQLAAWAYSAGTAGLFISLQGSGSGASRSPIRPLALWEVLGIGNATVYEVDKNLGRQRKRSAHARGEEHDTPWCWGPAYWEAFEARDFRAIRKQAAQAQDRLLLRVADQMENEAFLPREVVV